MIYLLDDWLALVEIFYSCEGSNQNHGYSSEAFV